MATSFPGSATAGTVFLAQNKKDRSAFYLYNMVIQFFVETFVSIAIGYVIGHYLDLWLFEGQTILTYVFIVLGIFSGLWMFIKRAMKTMDGGKKDEEDKHH